MRLVLFMLALCIGTIGHAQIYIECGQDPKEQQQSFETTEFVIWSETEELSGPAGGTWKFFDENDVEAFNAKLIPNNDNTLVLEVTHSQDLNGPVGFRYHFDKLGKENYSRHIQVIKEVMGGFTAGVKLATLDCRVDALQTNP